MWDCVDQCPILDHFANASSAIDVRFVDRDDCGSLQDELSVCGGARVPAVIFLSEDGFPVGRYGDRTLSRYRQMALQQFGPSYPIGGSGATEDPLRSVVQDWLNEFERIQLILRTSPRLRRKHGD